MTDKWGTLVHFILPNIMLVANQRARDIKEVCIVDMDAW